ncbi:MFS transporter [Oceanicella sp. SM1341]|uniref:MFS transporter n=1 Tax=Oceanicella sp. SM1341 TaxID=1548889 RepID=UPI000E4E3CBC|nr:MFS transporter [Oceanicella sp. SM1341]
MNNPAARGAGRPAILSAAGRLTCGYYAVMFLSYGTFLPFWPVWLEDWGLSPEEVGGFMAASVAARVVAGVVIPIIAEWLDQRRLTLVALYLGGAALFSACMFVSSPGTLFVVTVLAAIVFAGTSPISEILGVAAARENGFAYAHARAMGSIGFLGSNLVVGGLMASFGSDAALWWIVGSLLLAVPLAMRHPGGGRVGRANRAGFGEVRVLMRSRPYWLLACAVALLQGSHGVFYALGSVHWRDIGLGEVTIGALWAWGVAAETALMIFAGPWLINRLGPVGAMMLSGAAGVLRWGVMMADPEGAALWAAQGLHALTFAASHLGLMAFFQHAIPHRLAASAQGFAVQFLGNLVMAGSMALAGFAYPLMGGGIYGIAALLAGLGGLCALGLWKSWDRGPLLPA